MKRDDIIQMITIIGIIFIVIGAITAYENWLRNPPLSYDGNVIAIALSFYTPNPIRLMILVGVLILIVRLLMLVVGFCINILTRHKSEKIR